MFAGPQAGSSISVTLFQRFGLIALLCLTSSLTLADEIPYRRDKQTAEEHGWPCNWRLVELRGVGHSAKKMLAADTAVEALIPPK